MADFKTRIEDLVGHTVGSETSQYLRDGVLDVTNRTISIRPQDAELFMKSSQESTSQGGLDSHSGKIIAVVRESGTAGDWRPCRKIPIGLQSRVTDKSSLEYASAYSPAFTQSDDGVISVYPAPSGTSGNKYKIYHVNGSPVNTSNAGLVNTHTDIKYFPESMVHYVILYACARVCEDKIAALNLDLAEGEAIILPVPPMAPSMSSQLVSITGTAPTYNAPVLTLTALTQGDLTISSSAPSAPTISAPTVSLPGAGELPVYSPPVKPIFNMIAPPTISDLDLSSIYGPVAPTLEMSDDDIISKFNAIVEPAFVAPAKPALDWADANTWINTEEDIEMVQARMMEIDGKIKNYQAELTDSTAVFQRETTVFQKEVQKIMEASKTAQSKDSAAIQIYGEEVRQYSADIQKAINEQQTNNQKTIGLWQSELENTIRAYGEDLKAYSADIQNEMNKFNEQVTVYQAKVQKAQTDAQLTSAGEAQEIQKYQGEIDAYKTNINKEVQQYQTNFQTDFELWRTENANNLQKYSADIQNALNTFNKENVEYQAILQKNMADPQLADAKEQRDAQLYAGKVEAYKNELSAVIGKSAQSIENKTKEIGHYTILSDRFRAEYDKFFQISAPQQAPQQARR